MKVELELSRVYFKSNLQIPLDTFSSDVDQ